jgi:response regulator RpfG family c-di-GMP phosphodiesterase
MNISTRFIIIDDDEVNNKMCTMTLEKMDKNANIETFLDPFEGFNHIVSEYSNPEQDFTAIVFLDISMPGMDGWEFIDRFDNLDPKIKSRIKINILSASDDKKDMKRAKENKNVMHYLIKPLTRETIRLITYSQNR